MAKETTYKSTPFIFRSRGLVQRYATDRPPTEAYFQNMTGVLEREEDSVSTRYGSVILNRDPDGTPNGQNYSLPQPPITLGRLLGLNGASYRYAGLSNGTLWRRAGTTQGPYAEIASGLSGQPFTALVTTTFGSSLPFLFCFDRTKMLKDSGTGSPTQVGIYPPTFPVIATEYAPEILVIDDFLSSDGYSPVDMTLLTNVSGAVLTVALGNPGYGYQVGDVLTLIQGSPIPSGSRAATVTVTSVYSAPFISGIIGSFTLTTSGYGYTAGGALGGYGHGTGATFDITEVATPTSAVATSIAGTDATPILDDDYDQYTDSTGSYASAPDGMLATSNTFNDGSLRLKFNTFAVNNTYDIVALNGVYAASDTFVFNQVEFAIASSTTGYIGKTVALDLSKYQGDDLIAIVLQCSNPENIQGIQVEFDVNGSDYGASYYWKSIVPVSWQGSVSEPQSNDPTTAMFDSVFDLAMGITNTSQQVGESIQNYPTVPNNLQGVQPSQMGSGQGSWSVIYLPKGQFQAAGTAGQDGADWSKITGWRVQVTTNSNGSSTIAFNGLYIQGSPTATGVGTNAGASSYGGVGYDFRFTYFDATTLTESNGCPSASFSVTPTNPGGSSTLVPLRQAIDLELQYSTDPQVTHVRVYARGGVFGNNWYYADQVPNVTGTGIFHYDYILPDEVLEQGDILSLTNDVPVTAPLPNPIATTITTALNPTPANTNTPTLLTITVADGTAVFVPYQVVVLGGPQNLEQVYVVTGGVGTLTAYVQLPHPVGDPVNVYAAPGQPVYLAALAYGQIWMAGDTQNPNSLYFTPRDQPQYCPPQNRIAIGTPTDPITAVINHRGTLFVRTFSTWYQIFPGSPPTYQSTGAKHGSPANFDWSVTETEIWFQAFDGLRAFRGADAEYKSLIIEWLYRDNPLALVPLVDLTQLGAVISAFKNNTVTFSYIGQDGNRHRLLWNQSYKRYRNDDVQVSAMLAEPDTNELVYAIPFPNQPNGWAIVTDVLTQDYDDGGWVNGELVENAIPMVLQLPYIDLNSPNNQKQWNQITIDADPQGEEIDLQLLFDDNNGSVAPIDLGTFTGSTRQKFQFIINGGLGQQAYKISPKFISYVTAAPIIYQADIEAAVLPSQTNSYDSYLHKFGTDESKLIKQLYVDYTTENGSGIFVQLFADGNTVPYYTFTLPSNTTRSEVPMRVRLPAIKLRLLRVVMTSPVADGSFQLWSALQVDQKMVIAKGAKGYERSELTLAGTP